MINFSTQELKSRFSTSIKGVPLLVIYNKEKTTHYIGGYARAAITPLTDINITQFLTTLRQGKKLSSLPVIGCTVSKKYQTLLDPLGLKYTKRES